MANLFLQFIFNKKILATQKACWSFQNKFAIKQGGKKKKSDASRGLGVFHCIIKENLAGFSERCIFLPETIPQSLHVTYPGC